MRLIDADVLKKEYRMADRCEDCERNSRDCQNVYSWTLMDVCSMLDEAPTAVSWISVKGRLPDENCYAACLWKSKNDDLICMIPQVCEYSKSRNDWYGAFSEIDDVPAMCWSRFERSNYDVVYWMSLPEPPKGDKAE